VGPARRRYPRGTCSPPVWPRSSSPRGLSRESVQNGSGRLRASPGAPPPVSESVGKTDREEGMRESNSEGVANHADPESCVGFPRGGGEALTGARAGWDTELRKRIPWCGRRGCRRNATRGGASARVPTRPRGVEDPKHVRNLFVREPRDPAEACKMDAGSSPEAEQMHKPKASRRKSDKVVVPKKRSNNTHGGSRRSWREGP
jgi:hypothetical protein